MTQDDIVEVENFSTRMEVEIAAGVLAAEGIYTRVSADDAGGGYPSLQYIRGVRLMVLPEDEKRARRVLTEWREARPLEDEEDTG